MRILESCADLVQSVSSNRLAHRIETRSKASLTNQSRIWRLEARETWVRSNFCSRLSVIFLLHTFYNIFQPMLSRQTRQIGSLCKISCVLKTDHIKRRLKLHKVNTLWPLITLYPARNKENVREKSISFSHTVCLNWGRQKKKSKFACFLALFN